MSRKWYSSPKYLAGDKCRFCPHTAKWHLDIKNFGMDNQMAKWDKCQLPIMADPCDCPGFAPVDNLEYLEMKVDNQ